jgi:hypothetical protein
MSLLHLIAWTVITFPSLVTFAETEKPTLIGGTIAKPSDWPASVYASLSGSRCSATVVGPRVLAIAAHCSSGKVSFSVGPNNYKGSCSNAREYSSNSTADYSLCLLDREVVGIPYESLNQDASRLKTGAELLLTGYGCIRKGGGGGNDGNYRIGRSRITRLPSGSSNDIVTVGTAALCFGDSGGPAFLIGSNGERWVASVNSRGDIRSTSYLSSWSSSTAKAFIERWYTKFGQPICGVHPGASGCRSGGDSIPLSEFEVENEMVRITGKVKSGYEKSLPDIKKAVVDALQEVK